MGGSTQRQRARRLRVARADVLNLFGKFISDTMVSESDKTAYRYYCEAVMVELWM